METKNQIVEPGKDTPVMDNDKELTPKAEAREANKLPPKKQLEHFEEVLEEKDPGNQPS
jgi:hypothetical protein